MAREPRVALGRHVACLTHLENAQHGVRNVTNVVIKTISVHVVGPNSQEMGTGDPGADPKDCKGKGTPSHSRSRSKSVTKSAQHRVRFLSRPLG